MTEPTSVDRDLRRLAAELKRLETEYTMFFAGRLPKPPWATRPRVEAIVKHYDCASIQNYGDMFRFLTLQSRFYGLHRSLGSRAARAGGRKGGWARSRAA